MHYAPKDSPEKARRCSHPNGESSSASSLPYASKAIQSALKRYHPTNRTSFASRSTIPYLCCPFSFLRLVTFHHILKVGIFCQENILMTSHTPSIPLLKLHHKYYRYATTSHKTHYHNDRQSIYNSNHHFLNSKILCSQSTA